MKTTITEKERAKCKKVAEAYAELCEDKGIVLLDAGKYGFVKLSEYDPHDGFQSTELFTDSKELFDNLWKNGCSGRFVPRHRERNWRYWTARIFCRICLCKNRKLS